MTFDSAFAEGIYTDRYKHPTDGNWSGTAARVAHHPFEALRERTGAGLIDDEQRVRRLFETRKAMPGGRYLYATGRDLHQVNNCVLLRCPDNREGWAMTSYQAEMSLMTGAGIGVWYGDVRGAGEPIRKTGGIASGPIPKMQQVNETGRHTMQGGNRRSAIWAGLPWWHPDIFDFIEVKDWSEDVRAAKAKDWTAAAPCDMTNISVTLDDAFFACYAGPPSAYVGDHKKKHGWSAPDGGNWHDWAVRVYDTAVQHMLKHGEPGFSIDTGEHAGEVLRNACTEITSADDSDVCNLGSLVLPRFDSVEEFERACRDMVMFLTAGTVYSDVPYDKVAEIREKNRRLGMGLIGVHEFCVKHGARYGSDEAMELLLPYMEVYGRSLEFAWAIQDSFGMSRSLGATAIAPNGTIGIVAESTPSADPLFSAAEIREVKIAGPWGDTYERHVVVDPTAARLVKEGVDPDLIEDAATLSMVPERRLAMQAYLQSFTDHAISSTLNLPGVVTDKKDAADFGNTLMKYLPNLRGITVYPDGARAGQPRTPCDLAWALENVDTKFEGTEETCSGGVCGV